MPKLPVNYVPVAEEQLSLDAQYLHELRAGIYRAIARSLRSALTWRDINHVISGLEQSALVDECRAAYREYARKQAIG